MIQDFKENSKKEYFSDFPIKGIYFHFSIFQIIQMHSKTLATYLFFPENTLGIPREYS